MSGLNPDTIAQFLGDAPPPSAQLLGWTFQSWDAETKTLTLTFDGKDDFKNPAGVIQGGFLAAMLDDTMGPALVIASAGKLFGPTIDLNIQFLRPVRVGQITVKARVTQMGRTVAFQEAELFDYRGRLCARATCSSALIANPIARPASQQPETDDKS